MLTNYFRAKYSSHQKKKSLVRAIKQTKDDFIHLANEGEIFKIGDGFITCNVRVHSFVAFSFETGVDVDLCGQFSEIGFT